MEHVFSPIGVLHTCFKEKFGVPRQALMVPQARGILKLGADPSYQQAVNLLDGFSHVWIVFVFHKNGERRWRPIIEPPKLDAAKTVGVFASRSPHRPNPIGVSAVKLDRIDLNAASGIEIHLSGVDLLDGTPVLDLKPYLPYADCLPEATAGWASGEIERYPVEFSAESLQAIETVSTRQHPQLRSLIEQMLEWDPRPTSQRRSQRLSDPETEGKRFAFRVLDLDVHWQVRGGSPYVVDVVSCR